MWISAHDQGDLFSAAPALQLLFAGEGFVDFIVRLPVEQPDDLVAIGESLEVMKLVLEDAAVEVAGHSDVKGAGGTSHDVGAVVTAVARHGRILDNRAAVGCDGRHNVHGYFPGRDGRWPGRSWVNVRMLRLRGEARYATLIAPLSMTVPFYWSEIQECSV